MTDKPTPPTIDDLEARDEAPWKTARITDYSDDETLYRSLREFSLRYLSFTDRRYYDVITSWALHTWLIDRWRASGPLCAIGPKGSGKTTMLEFLEEVAFRGIRGGSMTEAAMFRLNSFCQPLPPTFLLDETQLYNNENFQAIQAFLNERYKKGGVVWRVEGDSHIPTRFPCYGATATAQSDIPWEAYGDRAIILKMEKAQPKSETLTEEFYEAGARLRGQLAQYRLRFNKQPHQETALDRLMNAKNDKLENNGITLNPYPDPRMHHDQLHDPRVREIAWPLIVVAPIGGPTEEGPRDMILGYFQDLEKDHNAEEAVSYLSNYVLAITQAVLEDGKVSAREIRLQLATIYGLTTDSKSLPKPRTIMSALRTLGFTATRVGHESIAGVLVDPARLERLKTRFRISPVSSAPPAQSSVMPTMPRQREIPRDPKVTYEQIGGPD